jgi:CheY-like chemotaxis protein
MRVLILEDSPERHKVFRRKLRNVYYVITDDAPTTIELLNRHYWDVLFLDHDLQGKAFVRSGRGTGYEVANWLAHHPHRMPKQIIIHSMNPAGARNMKRVLPRAILAPGCWNDIRIIGG